VDSANIFAGKEFDLFLVAELCFQCLPKRETRHAKFWIQHLGKNPQRCLSIPPHAPQRAITAQHNTMAAVAEGNPILDHKGPLTECSD
jgi:hypothetical protein